MIDYFALALTHGLILIALWRLAGNPTLDEDPALPLPRKRHNAQQAANDAPTTIDQDADASPDNVSGRDA